MHDDKTPENLTDPASRWAWAMPPEPSPRDKTVKTLADSIMELILAGNGPRRIHMEKRRHLGSSR